MNPSSYEMKYPRLSLPFVLIWGPIEVSVLDWAKLKWFEEKCTVCFILRLFQAFSRSLPFLKIKIEIKLLNHKNRILLFLIDWMDSKNVVNIWNIQALLSCFLTMVRFTQGDFQIKMRWKKLWVSSQIKVLSAGKNFKRSGRKICWIWWPEKPNFVAGFFRHWYQYWYA